MVETSSNMFNHVQTCSNMFNHQFPDFRPQPISLEATTLMLLDQETQELFSEASGQVASAWDTKTPGEDQITFPYQTVCGMLNQEIMRIYP